MTYSRRYCNLMYDRIHYYDTTIRDDIMKTERGGKRGRGRERDRQRERGQRGR